MTLRILAVETAGAIMADAALTIVIGFVVVFAVLLLLTSVFKVFGVVMKKLQSGHQEEIPSQPIKTESTPAVSVDLGPVMSTARIRNGISDEQAAVVAAAVAATLPATEKYTITKIDLAD